MAGNFSDSQRQALTQQLRTVLSQTENSGRTSTLYSFSDAKSGQSTYSFGLQQFDVGKNPAAATFLKNELGFSDGEVNALKVPGSLTSSQLAPLNQRLLDNKDKIDAFSNAALERQVDKLDALISEVRTVRPDVADAITANPRLQLRLLDYDNQFNIGGVDGFSGKADQQMMRFLKGEYVPMYRDHSALSGSGLAEQDLINFRANTKQGIKDQPEGDKREDRLKAAFGQIDFSETDPASAPTTSPSSTDPLSGITDELSAFGVNPAYATAPGAAPSATPSATTPPATSPAASAPSSSSPPAAAPFTPQASGEVDIAELPDGTKVESQIIVQADGTLVQSARLLGPEGAVLLETQAGETLVRDPETGVVSVQSPEGAGIRQYDPETGEVSEPGLTQSPEQPANPGPQSAAEGLTNALADAFETAAGNPVDFSQGEQVAAADTGTMSDASSGFGEEEGQVNSPPVEGWQAKPDGVVSETPSTSSAQTTTAYAQGVLSAVNLMQALEHGNTLSAALNAAGVANSFSAALGKGPMVGSGLTGSLTALSSALNLADSLESGDTGSVIVSGVSLANALGDNFASQQIGSLVGMNAANVLPVLNILNAASHGDTLGMAIAATASIGPYGPAISIGLSICRAFGLFGGGDEGEKPYVWVKAIGDADYVRHADGSIGITASGTHEYKSYDTPESGPNMPGAQVVRSALQGLLNELQADINSHNTANPDNPLALVPERLPEIHWRDPAYYIQWTDAESGESRSLMTSGTYLADNLKAVAQAGESIVPQWQADTITEHLKTDPNAWQVAPDSQQTDKETQTQNILTISDGSMTGTILSDIDSDGWYEAHGWNPNALYLGIDSAGDGQINGFADLLNSPPVEGWQAKPDGVVDSGSSHAPNSLNWLDANADGKITASDPAFAAIKLWLDSNGNALEDQGEAVKLSAAGISAIDFGSNPPQLIDSEGQSIALTPTLLHSAVSGIRAEAATGGTIVHHEDGNSEQLAQTTGDLSNDASHIHAEEQQIDAGSSAIKSDASPNTSNTAGQKTTTTITAGDARITSTLTLNQTQTPNQKTETAPARMGFVPALAALGSDPDNTGSSGQTTGGIRQVTQGMIQSAQNDLVGNGLNLGVLSAVGLGAVQSAALASENAAIRSAETSYQNTSGTSRNTLATSALTDKGNEGNQTNDLNGGQSAIVPPTIPQEPARIALQSQPVSAPPALRTEPIEGQTSSRTEATPPRSAETQADKSGSSVVLTALLSSHPQAPAKMRSAAPASAPEQLASSTPSQEPSSTPAPAQTSTTTLSYPVVEGEKLNGTEDTLLRIADSLLLANDSTANADAGGGIGVLRIIAVGSPLHGSVSLESSADGSTEVVFTPETDFHGTASFTYTVSDINGLTSTATATLDIAAVNDAPVTAGEVGDSLEDVALLFTQAQLLDNDSDVDTVTDGQVLSISRVGEAAHGTVWLDETGNVRFLPDTDYHGPASFTYWVADGAGAETPATVNLTLAAVNDLPVATGENINSEEDVTLRFDPATLLANESDVDTDTDGQVLSISAVSGAEHGTVRLLEDGQIEFVPEANYFGLARFSYTVSDGNGGTAEAVVVVNLAEVNDAPVAVDDALDAATSAGVEDTALHISLAQLLGNDSDVDTGNDALGGTRDSFSLYAVGNASHGSVAMNNGEVVFTPDADYHGEASFDYEIEDAAGARSQATARFSVAAVNDVPVVAGEIISTQEDEILTIDSAALLSNDSDVDTATDGQVLSISAVSGAEHGAVRLLADGQIEFVPDTDYNGAASFTYTVSDGNGGTAEATATLEIAAVNDVPVVTNETISGKSSVVMVISQGALLANDQDIDDGDVLSVSLVGAASHGAVSLQADGSIRFTPESGFVGMGGFDYTVSDGQGGETVAHATLDLTRQNIAPTVVDDAFSGTEDVTLVIDPASLLANDSDPDNATSSLTISGVSGAQHGTVDIGSDGKIRYTPEANYNGAASFSYTVSDGDGGAMQGKAIISIAAVNDAPVVTSGSACDGKVVAYDIEGSALTYTLLTAPAHGSAAVTNRYDAGGYQHTWEEWVSYGPESMWSPRLIARAVGNVPPGNVQFATTRWDTSLGMNVSSYVVVGSQDGNGFGIFWYQRQDTWVSNWVSDPGRYTYSNTYGDTYSGSNPFQIQVADAEGASTVVTINAYHTGSSSGGGGGGGGGGKPVTLDLDGDGLQFSGLNDAQVYYDINNDGWRERMAWTGGEDALLALDKDGDSTIDQADEISFVGYLPGAQTDLEGLKAFDSNQDGVLDALDARWGQFGAWQDKNRDGVCDTGEFRTLDGVGIRQIGLESDHVMRQEGDAVVFGTAQFVRTDGTTGAVGDVAFAVNNQDRLPVEANAPPAGEAVSSPPVAEIAGVSPLAAAVTNPPAGEAITSEALTAEVTRQALLFSQSVNTANVANSQPQTADEASTGWVDLTVLPMSSGAQSVEAPEHPLLPA